MTSETVYEIPIKLQARTNSSFRLTRDLRRDYVNSPIG
jgi:hypothetical protein